MKLSIGIVGLPNVGKSTLFNALLKKQVAQAANYPFCTIEPNVGVVEVPDDRLKTLAKIVNTQKVVPAIVEFYDIAGLVAGASTGEGLGNKFLSHIREVAAIVHVVRVFDDKDVVHVKDTPNPEEDIKTIETELILADLQTLEKQKEPRGKVEKDQIYLWEAVQILIQELNKGRQAKDVLLTDEQKNSLKSINLLTMKPIIYAYNVSENQINQKINENLRNPHVIVSAKIESELAGLSQEEQVEYLKSLGMNESGLDRLIKAAYETLGLISFLTAGEIEAKAWTIEKNTLAPQAAGVIHTDFEKKFIKADVVNYKDFVENNGWIKCRELGKVRSEGKDYLMQDGDVVEFKIGA